MEEVLTLIAKSFLEHGPLGLLALTGWALAGWFLYKDIKKKEEVNRQVIEAKDKLAETIRELSEKRLEDAKESIEDYNELATSTVQTLDRLTAALEVKNQFRGE